MCLIQLSVAEQEAESSFHEKAGRSQGLNFICTRDGQKFGADQRHAAPPPRVPSLPFSRMSKFLGITAGPCPGRAQRAVGEPGRVAEIHTITLEKMAGYHFDISWQVPLASLSRFHPHFL
jgi:hypothetical protein